MPVEFIRITPGKSARVRIIADTRFAGKHLAVGTVVDVPEDEAHLLVMASKAEFYTAAPEKEKPAK